MIDIFTPSDLNAAIQYLLDVQRISRNINREDLASFDKKEIIEKTLRLFTGSCDNILLDKLIVIAKQVLLEEEAQLKTQLKGINFIEILEEK